MRYVLSRWQTWVAALLVAAAQGVGVWQYSLSYPGGNWRHAYANAAGYYSLFFVSIFLPLAIGLATGYLTATDRQSGELRGWLLRTTRLRYVMKRATAECLAALLVGAVPVLATGLAVATFWPIDTSPPPFDTFTAPHVLYLSQVFWHAWPLYALVSAAYVGVAAIGIGACAMYVGLITRNVYLASALPWCLYLATSSALADSGIPALRPFVPLWDATVFGYNPGLRGSIWAAPLGWLVVAGIFILLSLFALKGDVWD